MDLKYSLFVITLCSGPVLLIMNPRFKRRIPPSLRNLLTDIAPKQEWTDADPDKITRDSIILPSRGASSGEGEFLMPAETQEREDEAASAGGNARSGVCMLCKRKISCYTCPRCNLHYCSLACYQSPDHSVCSETFYKEAVLQDLKDMGTTESEGRRKMQEVLVRLRQKAERTDGGMASLLREAGIVSDGTKEWDIEATEKVQVVELLSRLAELQQSREGNGTEIEDILRKLAEIGGELQPGEIDEDTRSTEEDQNLAERLAGLDIEQLSEEELWGHLNSKEKEVFIGLLRSGDLTDLVPLWRPWWEVHEEGGRPMVEVLEEKLCKVEGDCSTTTDEMDIDNNKMKTPQGVVHNQSKQDTKSKEFKGGKRKHKNKGQEGSSVTPVPPISVKIPKLSSLCTRPSPLVCYGLINVLYAYTFSLCLVNNDTDSLMFEFCDIILNLSEALTSSRVFNSLKEAIDSGEGLILGGGYLDKNDRLAPARSLEAVAHIMTGRDGKDTTGYCLSALSQLRAVLSQARKTLSKEGEEGERRQKYFLANKKCEFFQAWALDNGHQIQTLAIELWNEHGKRESARSNMEKAKTVVKESLKKEKSQRNMKLIEELC